ncbi:MAG: iron complex transport system permease protein, partial [Flavobacteriaceae bacterium]
MENNRSYRVYFIIMLLALVVFFILNISLGSVSIPFKDVISSLLGSSSKESWHYIIIDYRLPKSLTAIITGGGLAVAGLLMQTLFRNPLAGPFVLGLSSGASLGVAILILGASAFGSVLGGFLLNSWSLVIASALGSFLVLLAVMAVALRVKDTMAILIIGLMFGSVTGAVVSVLSYFSDAEQLQQYIFWSFGSLGNMSWNNLIILSICFIIGILTSI